MSPVFVQDFSVTGNKFKEARGVRHFPPAQQIRTLSYSYLVSPAHEIRHTFLQLKCFSCTGDTHTFLQLCALFLLHRRYTTLFYSYMFLPYSRYANTFLQLPCFSCTEDKPHFLTATLFWTHPYPHTVWEKVATIHSFKIRRLPDWV
jgi:hypothetical protein